MGNYQWCNHKWGPSPFYVVGKVCKRCKRCGADIQLLLSQDGEDQP